MTHNRSGRAPLAFLIAIFAFTGLFTDARAQNQAGLVSDVLWEPLGSGTDDYVHALAVGPDGVVYAGGEFTEAGGQAANYIAMWDGSEWSSLGDRVNGQVRAIRTARC